MINYNVANSHFPLYVTYHTGDEWLGTNKQSHILGGLWRRTAIN